MTLRLPLATRWRAQPTRPGPSSRAWPASTKPGPQSLPFCRTHATRPKPGQHAPPRSSSVRVLPRKGCPARSSVHRTPTWPLPGWLAGFTGRRGLRRAFIPRRSSRLRRSWERKCLLAPTWLSVKTSSWATGSGFSPTRSFMTAPASATTRCFMPTSSSGNRSNSAAGLSSTTTSPSAVMVSVTRSARMEAGKNPAGRARHR